ncbi:uncharacterized protein LOC123988423 [Osmia bicornis bicornis]|uniref:uncharacterized protein LOC123988423 n=1 Tax=Osmia bicornis bicornis TaxID=1437191 RepID=UPI001EAED24A|nr:uncharacterized protein LOC123988423 [Osmia bicornis bicornis]
MTDRSTAFHGSEYLEITHQVLRVHKGVPQGGVLSPLLFSLYISSVTDGIPEGVTVTLFADDIAVISQNSNLHDLRSQLQNAVNVIKNNLESIGFNLSTEKTELLSFGRSPHKPVQADITLGGHTINSRPVAKYLGVNIDHKFKFREHVQAVLTQCNKTLNVIKFLRGTWWGCDPQSLIIIYKTLIRSRIEYGSMWYLPSDNRSRAQLEGIQMEALRLAMGYRRSTPTNVILGETKLLSIKDRTSYLGSRYVLKVLTNGANPFIKVLADFCEVYRNQEHISNPEIDKDRPLVRIINLIEEFTPLLVRLPNLGINTAEYATQYTQPKIETEFISKSRNTPNPMEIFQDTIHNKYQNHKIIYTDGSKFDNSPSVGAACVIPQDNYIGKITLPNQASIFTAECIALELATDYINRYHQHSYVICTDSLSLVQTLFNPGIGPQTNRHIINIKSSLRQFKVNAPNQEVVVMWVPAHRGIEGNELADRHAKAAAQSIVKQLSQVPYTDVFPLLKQKIKDSADIELTRQGRYKGTKYFREFYAKSKAQPWFHNKNLSRHTTVWINRARANHFHLKASLARVGMAQDTRCQCGYPMEDIDHILWDCTLTREYRKEMLQQLRAKGVSPPFSIDTLLVTPNISALKIIEVFLIKNSLKL